MRIQILGTAAAEGWPAIFCGCETCTRAREAGGKDIRSRSSVQIDDIFKIDLPPDTYYHTIRFDLRLANLKHLFITHSHEDHFAADYIEYFRPPFAYNLADPPVNIYGNPAVISVLESRHDFDALPIRAVPAKPFVPIQADHLTFTPIAAVHKPDEDCLNYVIQDAGSTVLYAADTGLYGPETMDFISAQKFDLTIIECTQGANEGPSQYHMGFAGVLELRDKLAQAGAVTPDTMIVLTHFSHNIGMLHDEFAAIAGKEGIDVAYDGLVLED